MIAYITDQDFKSYRECIFIKDHIKAKHIVVGDYSYYSGYYHGKKFQDCVMYLDENDNHRPEDSLDRLIIGKFCSIATGAKFMLGGTQGHNYNWVTAYPLDYFDDDKSILAARGSRRKGNTIIGDDVWIGAEALIMPGVKIANGAVIAARAVVTKDVGPYEIWGGLPAEFIKKRFSDDHIEKLLQIKWWNWDIPMIKRNLDLLRSSKIDELWDKFQKGTL